MLLLAAGRGERLGAARPKAFVECRGASLLRRSLLRLRALDLPGQIVAAVNADDRRRYLEPELAELQRCGLALAVDGGATRQESMRRALDAAAADCDIALVHDAARPFFPLAAAKAAVDRAAAAGAAILAIPVPDTLKRVGDRCRILETVDRRGLWLAQTPQVARRDLLAAALANAERQGYRGTDDASLLELAGVPVEVVLGSPLNIKITTPEDLRLAEMLAAQQDGSREL